VIEAQIDLVLHGLHTETCRATQAAATPDATGLPLPKPSRAP